jgi:hypothetical protein
MSCDCHPEPPRVTRPTPPMRLRHMFDDVNLHGERVDYFRDERDRCVRVQNAKLDVPAVLVTPEPIVRFDAVEIDGVEIKNSPLVERVRDALKRFNWTMQQDGDFESMQLDRSGRMRA